MLKPPIPATPNKAARLVMVSELSSGRFTYSPQNYPPIETRVQEGSAPNKRKGIKPMSPAHHKPVPKFAAIVRWQNVPKQAGPEWRKLSTDQIRRMWPKIQTYGVRRRRAPKTTPTMSVPKSREAQHWQCQNIYRAQKYRVK